MSSWRRITIAIPDELYRKVQRLRGEWISETGKGVSFTRVAVLLMERALKEKQ